MTRLSDYEDYYGDNAEEYDSEYYSNDETDEELPYELENNLDFYEDPDDLLYKVDDQVVFEWKYLTIGETTIKVSNTGAIQYPNSIFETTYGNPVPGTPYRCVAIKVQSDTYRNYYVHDLVWMAFNGDIPNGWEVGHKDRIYDKTLIHKYYKNDLEYLDIYMNIVSREFIL